MPRRPSISDEERALFRAAVADAKPLPPTTTSPSHRRRPKPAAKKREADERAVLEELAAAIPDGELETGDEVAWRMSGVQLSVMRKLRRGQFKVARELDLHGLTADEAKVEVVAFIHRARLDGTLCVRIIHGKGRGSRTGQSVLKQRVGGWLRQHSGVMAYITPRAIEGGTGALTVLLRKAE